jgi:hypothetical protein
MVFVEGENPYLSRQDMRRVTARTIDLYQRQKGAPPKRLVVHKTTQFRPAEIDGCIDALGAVDDLELLTVSVSYASVLARVVKRLGTLSSSPYDFRFFM